MYCVSPEYVINMAKIKAYFDPIANTLNLWWGKKSDAVKAVPVQNPNRDDVIVVDKNNRPISLEIIGLLPEELDPVGHLSKEQIRMLLDSGKVDFGQWRLVDRVVDKGKVKYEVTEK